MSELVRRVTLRRIGSQPYSITVTATEAERAAIATRLGIQAVASLECRFDLRPAVARRIAATGALDARVTQLSVVSLEPFEADVVEAFDLVFVPPEELLDEDAPLDLDAPDELPIDGDAVDVGEAAIQQLALALDPYPKRDDEVFAPAPADPDPRLAGLAALRRKPAGDPDA